DELVAVEVEREGVAAAQRYAPQTRVDRAAVTHARRHERREAGVADRDLALVDDRRVGPARLVEMEPAGAGHELVVGDVAGGGDEAGDVDARRTAEQDAVGVGEPHL